MLRTSACTCNPCSFWLRFFLCLTVASPFTLQAFAWSLSLPDDTTIHPNVAFNLTWTIFSNEVNPTPNGTYFIRTIVDPPTAVNNQYRFIRNFSLPLGQSRREGTIEVALTELGTFRLEAVKTGTDPALVGAYTPAFSVVDINAPSSSATPVSNPTPTESTSSNASKETPVGAIVGGVIGGIAAISLAVLLFLLIRRRRQRHSASSNNIPAESGQPKPMNADVDQNSIIVPFPQISTMPPVVQPPAKMDTEVAARIALLEQKVTELQAGTQNRAEEIARIEEEMQALRDVPPPVYV